MKKYFLAALALFSITCTPVKSTKTSQEPWVSLWNGEDLTGWHSYLGTPFRVEKDSLGNAIAPFGVDHDPLGVIQVVQTIQGNAIRISGVAWGMIYTEKEFKNYHLKLKVKWGEAMHSPREKGPRDSGLLYHGFGPPGAADDWMASQELQIQEGDMGDYWPVGDVEIDIPSVAIDDKYFKYKENAALRTYYNAEILQTSVEDSLAKRRVIKSLNAEKPHGEWNDIELITYGDSSIHIVNGQVVMRLFNSRKAKNNQSLDSGKIILQSEGAEVYYKDIYLKKLSAIPEKYK